MNKIIIFVSVLFLLNSCYEKEDISADLGKPLHEFKDGPTTVDHKIFEYFEQTGVGILYNYVERDYNWNLTNTISTRLYVTQQKNQDYLLDGIEYINKVFSGNYSQEFQKKYFPLYFLMADTTTQDGTKYKFFCGRNYMLFSDINKDCGKLSLDELNERKGLVNSIYWSNYIYANDLMTFPDEFFEISKDYYEHLFGDAKKIDIKKYGFWDGDPNFAYHPKQYKGPNKAIDIEQFFYRICSQTKQEMEASMKGYDLLKSKYDILLAYFKRVYNIDIQEIGNNKIK